ncbi:MAG: hypothetical protein IJ779_07330, partial [Ruminococcus sp.]|nr:hypothetical protein [Ruminococcus sp.]
AAANFIVTIGRMISAPTQANFMRNPRALGKRPYITAPYLLPSCESRVKDSQRVNELCEWERVRGCPNVRQDTV